MPRPPRQDRSPPRQFGRIHPYPGVFAIVFSLVSLAASIAIVFGSSGAPVAARAMGAALGALAIWLNWKTIARIPVLETDAEGITLRPVVGAGRIFVRWEDAEGVVIWHDKTGGGDSTMVAISTAEDFEYDNYGLHRAVRRVRNPSMASKVKRRWRSWSVNLGKASGRRLAQLVNASGKGVPVVEELPGGDLWNHSGPQWGSGV